MSEPTRIDCVIACAETADDLRGDGLDDQAEGADHCVDALKSLQQGYRHPKKLQRVTQDTPKGTNRRAMERLAGITKGDK
jgi:hypothetical protein